MSRVVIATKASACSSTASSAFGSASPAAIAISTAAAASQRFGTGDGNRACLIGAADAPGALRGVETRALRSAHRSIAKVTVANLCFAHGFEQLHCDAIGS